MPTMASMAVILTSACIILASTIATAPANTHHHDTDFNDDVNVSPDADAGPYADDGDFEMSFDAEQEIDDYMRVQPYVSARELANPLVNHHKYSYIINAPHRCTTGHVFVLALVKTVPENFVERQEARDTWASVTSHNDVTVVHVFIMGKSKPRNGTEKVQQELLKESDKYGDIVQGDFIEYFKNQTYKTVMGLKWTTEFCSQAKFVLFTTDSTMVDTYHLVDFLKEKQSSNKDTNLLYCSAFVDIGPVRDPNNPEFVPIADYPYKVYPPHCEGFAYVLSGDALHKLLEATRATPYLWLDDVYVTGLLPSRAGLSHEDMAEQHSYTWMQQERFNSGAETGGLDKAMFLLAPYKELRKNWGKAWAAIQEKHK